VDVFGDTEGGLNALLVTLVAVPLGVLVLAVIILAAGRGEPDTTGRRAFAVYLAAVNFVAIFTLVFASFAAVLVALFALGVGAYGVFRTLAPGVTGEFTPRHLERQEGVAQLISQAWLGLVALYVFVRAWREVAADAA